MRIGRFHNLSMGSRATIQECLEQFMHYYNRQRPHQALDETMPVEEEVQN